MEIPSEAYTNEEILDMAEDYRRSGSLQQAVELYIHVIERNLDSGYTTETELARERLLTIAKEYESIGKNDLAINLYDRIVTLESDESAFSEEITIPDEAVGNSVFSLMKLSSVLGEAFCMFIEKRLAQKMNDDLLDETEIEQLDSLVLSMREEIRQMQIAAPIGSREEIHLLHKLF